jgi:hypothetical protein
LDALGVVEAFDVVEQCGAQRRSGGPGLGGMDPGELALERGEERLDCGVVVAVAGATEGLVELEVGDTLGEREARVDGAWSEWCTTRRSGRRRSNAMTSASVTSSAVTELFMAQPTTRRDHKSITAARCSQPSSVRNCVTSAAQSRSGPPGLKFRPTRPGAGAVSGRPRRHRRRAWTPTSSRERIRRATRLRPHRCPNRVSSACTRGAPYVHRDRRWISTMTSPNSVSLTDRGDGRRVVQA